MLDTDSPTLFKQSDKRPLAEKLRPEKLSDVVGQAHLLNDSGSLQRMLNSEQLSSIIFWGPPGCGKTTIARLLAHQSSVEFVSISAVFSGVAELRRIFEDARTLFHNGKQTLIFVDEVHRFNRAQQDLFLALVEDGTIILVGATTENPSFELNAALLSRCQIMLLNRLNHEALAELMRRSEVLEGRTLPLDNEARDALINFADGDGRFLLNLAQELFTIQNTDKMSLDELTKMLTRRAPIYDKKQDAHYNLISALHKSLRGSDADASIYWLSRMLCGGEDPNYIARRLVRFASEDIGLADPMAVTHAMSAWQAYERLGSPEGEIALVQAVVYLATAPKSNAIYLAQQRGKDLALKSGSLMPPLHILNAPTSQLKDLGYGDGYVYDHDKEDGFSGQRYFPENLKREVLYDPKNRGFEREIKKRLDYWDRLRKDTQPPKK